MSKTTIIIDKETKHYLDSISKIKRTSRDGLIMKVLKEKYPKIVKLIEGEPDVE